MEIFDLLAPLKALGLRFAMARMPAEDRDHMVDLHDTMMACYHKDAREGCFRSDYQFHNTLITMAQHEVLRTTHISLSNRSQRGRYLAPRFDQTKLDVAMTAHTKVIEAIKANDTDKAAEILHDHVSRTKEFVLATLRQSDLVLE